MERLWAEYGGFASGDLSEVALIYVLVEGPRRAAASRATVLAVLAACERAVGIRVPVLHLAPRTKEDAVRLPEVLPGPAPGAGLPDGLAPHGSNEEGRFRGLFHAVMPAPLHPVGDIAEVAPANASSGFSPVQIKG